MGAGGHGANGTQNRAGAAASLFHSLFGFGNKKINE
jgi:hypothetical protein